MSRNLGRQETTCDFPKSYQRNCRINGRKKWGDFWSFAELKRYPGEDWIKLRPFPAVDIAPG
jgi:hypothetical protein